VPPRKAANDKASEGKMTGSGELLFGAARRWLIVQSRTANESPSKRVMPFYQRRLTASPRDV